MKVLVLVLATTISFASYAVDESFEDTLATDNACYAECIETLNRLDPQNIESIKELPFCREEALNAFSIMTPERESSQELVVLQRCIIVEGMKCMESCDEQQPSRK